MPKDLTPARAVRASEPKFSRLRQWFEREIAARWRRNVFARKIVSVLVFPVADYRFRYNRRRGFCEVIEVGPERLAGLRDPNVDPLLPLLERWVRRGDLLFFAVKEGRVLGLIDLMRVDFRDKEGLYMPIGEGECKVRDIQVFPEYRRTPTLGVLHDVVVEIAAERGIHTVYGAVALGSKTEAEDTRGGEKALRSSKHLGYKEVRRTVCYRLFRVFNWWRDSWRASSVAEAREMEW